MPDNTSPTTTIAGSDQPADPGDAPPSSTTDTTAPRYASPIGVPQYTTDPSTGQVATDASGNPVPWFGAKSTPAIPNVFAGTGGSQATSYFGAQYHDGDEWAVIGNMPPELRSQVQQAMLDRGLFGSKKPNVALGSWDNESASAFKQVLAYANATGKDWQDALQSMPVLSDDELAAADGTKGSKRQINQIKLSNPQDLAQVFKNAAADLLGSAPPQEEIDKFVRAYQNSEREEQQTAIAQQAAAQRNSSVVRVGPDGQPIDRPAGTDYGEGVLPDSAAGVNVAVQPTDAAGNDLVETTSAPTAATAAADAIKKAHPGQYGATQLAGTFDKFLSILGGMSSPGSTQGTAV